jgi:hypothetical protein
MTARDTIATNVHAAWCWEPNHEDCDGVDKVDERVADAVIAAVRAMPVEDLPDVDIRRLRDTTPDSHRNLAAWHLAVAHALEAER